MDFTELLHENGACCACNEAINTSKHINIINTEMTAAWPYPVWGNFLTGIPANKAVAVVCDKCLDNKNSLKFVIELQDEKIIYHSYQAPQKNSPA